MELSDTIALMNSKDYKDRFCAEYWQTKIRFGKLKVMEEYLHLLEIRAVMEGVDLYAPLAGVS